MLCVVCVHVCVRVGAYAYVYTFVYICAYVYACRVCVVSVAHMHGLYRVDDHCPLCTVHMDIRVLCLRVCASVMFAGMCACYALCVCMYVYVCVRTCVYVCAMCVLCVCVMCEICVMCMRACVCVYT